MTQLISRIHISVLILFFVLPILALSCKTQSKMNAQNFKAGKNTVTFQSEGEKIMGTLFLPNDFDQSKKYPTVIVDGPWTQVKEQVGYAYGEELAKKGIVALAFDHRFYGESGGSPRQFESTEKKAEDISNAIGYLSTLPFVEQEKVIGLGVCAGAGNVILAATQDDRMKGIVTGAAWLQHPTTTPLFYGGEEGINDRIQKAESAFAKYDDNQTTTMTEAYNPENAEAAMFFPVDYYGNPERGNISAWKNEFAVQGWKEWLTLNSVAYAPKVNVPVLMVHSDQAFLPDNVKQFHADLKGEKELVWTEGEHTEFYDKSEQINEVVGHVVRFSKNL